MAPRIKFESRWEVSPTITVGQGPQFRAFLSFFHFKPKFKQKISKLKAEEKKYHNDKDQ